MPSAHKEREINSVYLTNLPILNRCSPHSSIITAITAITNIHLKGLYGPEAFTVKAKRLDYNKGATTAVIHMSSRKHAVAVVEAFKAGFKQPGIKQQDEDRLNRESGYENVAAELATNEQSRRPVMNGRYTRAEVPRALRKVNRYLQRERSPMPPNHRRPINHRQSYRPSARSDNRARRAALPTIREEREDN